MKGYKSKRWAFQKVMHTLHKENVYEVRPRIYFRIWRMYVGLKVQTWNMKGECLLSLTRIAMTRWLPFWWYMMLQVTGVDSVWSIHLLQIQPETWALHNSSSRVKGNFITQNFGIVLIHLLFLTFRNLTSVSFMPFNA